MLEIFSENGKAEITINELISEPKYLLITDITGKTIYKSEIFNNTISVNLNGYTESVFLVKVIIGSQEFNQKFILRK